MEEKNLINCSCCHSEKSDCKLETNNLCPVCQKEGVLVKNITVKHLVLDELTEQIGDKDYFLCMSEECDITYYNKESNIVFNKQHVKVPIWFKKDADPKYACYCSEVTEDQIINAVLRLTGAMNVAQCQKNNPLGKCCHQIIQDAIDKALAMK